MKNKSVKPLPKYAEPAYPTLVEIGRADLSRIPARWQGLRVVASSIGAAAMSLKALALEADAVVPSVSATPLAVVPDAEAPKETTARPVTEVCPLPAKEIAGDGAGAFGCVAMNPPHILPEGEALDFIAREFAKRGVVLRDCPVLEDVEMPVREWKPTLEEFAVAQKKAEAVGASVRAPRERRRMMLDFGTADGSLMVEYVSSSDERQWNFDPWRGAFTAWGYDMRGAAEDVVKGLRARTEGRPVTVGVFYDPCVCLPKGWKPTYPEGMTEDAPRSPLADRRPGGRDVRGRHVRLHPRRYGHRARDRPFLRKSLRPFQLRLTSGRGASPHLRLLQPARVVAPRLLRGRLPLNTILIEAESNPHILFVHCAAYERREEMDFFKLAITVLGGLSIFIYGMGLMSEGLTQIAGSRLKAALWSDARSALPLSPKGGLAMRMEERKRRKERRTRIEIAIGLAVVALLYLLQLFA